MNVHRYRYSHWYWKKVQVQFPPLIQVIQEQGICRQEHLLEQVQVQLVKGRKKYVNLFQSDIGYMYIFERDVDWASCLLSPLTYEGLLDEVFGIRYHTERHSSKIWIEI